MADSIPAALATSHQELIAAIDADKNRKGMSGSRSPHSINRTLERFVAAVCNAQGNREELQRRAALVEELCGEGTDYQVARTQVLAYLEVDENGLPRWADAAKCARTAIETVTEPCERLQRSSDSPIFLTELEQVRRDVAILLGQSLRGDACKALSEWVDVIEAVQDEACPLAADGCYFLNPLSADTEDTAEVRAMARSGSNLPDICAAADSLVERIAGNGVEAIPPLSDEANSNTQERRRLKVNDRMVAEMASNLEVIKGWTAQQWASYLGCGKTTVIETTTWKSLSFLRRQMKAEKRLDRHRAKKS